MRRSQTGTSFEELGRATRLSRIRPLPPRGVRFNAATGVLQWEAPAIKSNVTHYRVYAGSEFSLVREVPAGQLELSDNLTTGLVFVTAYNMPSGLESTRAVLNADVMPPSSAGTGAVQFVYSVVANASPYAVSEPATDDNGEDVTAAAIGDRMVLFAKQDGTGNRYLSFSGEFKVRGGNMVTTADSYTVFEFVKKSATDPKWWQVGGGIGYA